MLPVACAAGFNDLSIADLADLGAGAVDGDRAAAPRHRTHLRVVGTRQASSRARTFWVDHTHGPLNEQRRVAGKFLC
jgi:hypothetical protein